MAQTINSLDANLELEAIGIEEALEQQVADYFSDWEVEDYKVNREVRHIPLWRFPVHKVCPVSTVFPMCPNYGHLGEHRGNVQQKEIKMEQIKQDYKIVSLVDDRDTSDNSGCPLYHTRLVKADDGYDEVLKDFKGELDCFGITAEESNPYDIYVDGEVVPWGNEIAGMSLADIEARIGHKPRTYTIDMGLDGRVTHTLTDLT